MRSAEDTVPGVRQAAWLPTVSVVVALGLLPAICAPTGAAAMQPEAQPPGAQPMGAQAMGAPELAGTTASGAQPLIDWRTSAPWLGSAPGRSILGNQQAPPGLLLDLHPLDSGFRLSLGPGFERAPDPLESGFGTGPGSLYDPSWYMGMGWTGSIGGRVSLFVDIGAAYADSGLGLGVDIPPVTFDLRDQNALARPDDGALSRLFPMLNVSFAYRF